MAICNTKNFKESNLTVKMKKNLTVSLFRSLICKLKHEAHQGQVTHLSVSKIRIWVFLGIQVSRHTVLSKLK